MIAYSANEKLFLRVLLGFLCVETIGKFNTKNSFSQSQFFIGKHKHVLYSLALSLSLSLSLPLSLPLAPSLPPSRPLPPSLLSTHVFVEFAAELKKNYKSLYRVHGKIN